MTLALSVTVFSFSSSAGIALMYTPRRRRKTSRTSGGSFIRTTDACSDFTIGASPLGDEASSARICTYLPRGTSTAPPSREAIAALQGDQVSSRSLVLPLRSEIWTLAPAGTSASNQMRPIVEIRRRSCSDDTQVD